LAALALLPFILQPALHATAGPKARIRVQTSRNVKAAEQAGVVRLEHRATLNTLYPGRGVLRRKSVVLGGGRNSRHRAVGVQNRRVRLLRPRLPGGRTVEQSVVAQLVSHGMSLVLPHILQRGRIHLSAGVRASRKRGPWQAEFHLSGAGLAPDPAIAFEMIATDLLPFEPMTAFSEQIEKSSSAGAWFDDVLGVGFEYHAHANGLVTGSVFQPLLAGAPASFLVPLSLETGSGPHLTVTAGIDVF